MSTQSAGLAVNAGYSNVRVMLQGVPGWEESSRTVVASNNFVKTGNIILIDLRSQEEYEQGHIPGAHNIPLDALEDRLEEINKKAPVVVYGSPEATEEAYFTLVDVDVKKASIYPGSIEAWLNAGNTLKPGSTPESIVWVRKLGEGEVALADFVKVVETNPADQVILDVRTKDEAASGKFQHSVHIALDELENKIIQLSKEKEILIHCSTGARAEMAYEELKKAGYKSRFLVGNVECDGNECEVTD